MKDGKTDIKKGIFHRVRVLYILFFGAGVLIAGKILYLQYGPKGDALRSRGATITYARERIEADRGDILACDGRILATSVPEYELRMDFAAQGLIDSDFLPRRRFAGAVSGRLFRRQEQNGLQADAC